MNERTRERERTLNDRWMQICQPATEDQRLYDLPKLCSLIETGKLTADELVFCRPSDVEFSLNGYRLFYYICDHLQKEPSDEFSVFYNKKTLKLQFSKISGKNELNDDSLIWLQDYFNEVTQSVKKRKTPTR
jgi:hypothetical protein